MDAIIVKALLLKFQGTFQLHFQQNLPIYRVAGDLRCDLSNCPLLWGGDLASKSSFWFHNYNGTGNNLLCYRFKVTYNK